MQSLFYFPIYGGLETFIAPGTRPSISHLESVVWGTSHLRAASLADIKLDIQKN